VKKKKKGKVAEIELACRSIELVTSSSSLILLKALSSLVPWFSTSI